MKNQKLFHFSKKVILFGVLASFSILACASIEINFILLERELGDFHITLLVWSVLFYTFLNLAINYCFTFQSKFHAGWPTPLLMILYFYIMGAFPDKFTLIVLIISHSLIIWTLVAFFIMLILGIIFVIFPKLRKKIYP